MAKEPQLDPRLSEISKLQAKIIVSEVLFLVDNPLLEVLLKEKIHALKQIMRDFFQIELLGKPAHCSIRNVHSGHSAKIGAYRASANGEIVLRLDFTLIHSMSVWCYLENVVLV